MASFLGYKHSTLSLHLLPSRYKPSLLLPAAATATTERSRRASEDEDHPGVGDDGDPGGGDGEGLRQDDLRHGAAGHADPQLQAPQPRLPAARGRPQAQGGRLVRHPPHHGRHPHRHLPRPEPHHRRHQGLPLQDALRVRSLPHQRIHQLRQQGHRDQELPRREEGEESGHARRSDHPQVREGQGRDRPRRQRHRARLALCRPHQPEMPREEEGYQEVLGWYLRQRQGRYQGGIEQAPFQA